MPEQKKINRRNFVKASATAMGATAAVSIGAPAVLAGKSPNDTIGVGCIGLGVRGGTLLTDIAGRELGGGIQGAKIVAVCDVYKPHRQKGIDRCFNKEVKEYLDYKELLANPQVDVVTIATPDHWHSKILIDACSAGKDIYCEKGWTRSIEEAKAMRSAVKLNNTILQLGHQSRESTAGLQAKQLIAEGLLGPVTFVKTGRYMNGPLGKNTWRWYGWYTDYTRPNPDDVIKNLDWNRWLGSAPKCQFSMEHFWHWRCYWPYGTGAAGDLLSHELDFVQMVLGYGIPDTCVCSGLNALLKDGREVPDTWNVIYGFENRNCTVTFDATMNSSQLSQTPEFHGKDAVLRCNTIAQSVSDFDVYADPTSEKYSADIEKEKISATKPFLKFDPAKTPQQPSHMQNFFDCVRSRQKTKCNEDEAFIETATLLMSVESYKSGHKVRWDAGKEEISY